MAKGKRRGIPRVIGQIVPDQDPIGMNTLIFGFLEWMRVKGSSEWTLRNRIYTLRYFQRWCADRGLLRPREVTRPILERFQHYLFMQRRENGRPLAFSTQIQRLTSVQGFFRYLARNNFILSNPASDLDLPRPPQRLPRNVLSVEDVEQVLAQADLTDPLGLRNRAIMETFYSTGIRRAELARLMLYDLEPRRGVLMVREGKGRKDRVVPIGERALAWIEKYLVEVRSSLITGPDPGYLFLNWFGEPIGEGWLTARMCRYVRDSKVSKQGGCHLFRHTMATLMLEGGADVRFIQELLGHASLETTQIYTRVSIRKLKEIHTATHPGARLRAGHAEEEPAERVAESAARRAIDAAEKPSEQDSTARAALLSSLAAEAEEERE